MRHKLLGSAAVICVLSCLPFFASLSFPQSQSVDYICEMGVTFYRLGRFSDALVEFKKALTLDPENQIAKHYIGNIFNQEIVDSQKKISPPPEPLTQAGIPRKRESPGGPGEASTTEVGREQIISKELNRLAYNYGQGAGSPGFVSAKKETAQEKQDTVKNDDLIKVSGEAQASFGINSNRDFIWKRANYNLNERNWRLLSGAAFNNRFNTYDTRVYDSLDLVLDSNYSEGLNFHSNIVVDPWSFTGKSGKTSITSVFNDRVDIELKYVSATGCILNDTVYSSRLGNTFNIPELKVRNGVVDAFTTSGAFDPADSISVPSMKIYTNFQPMRELWVDYVQDPLRFRVFPIAYQDQAMVSDDPLNISNHHTWWENSLWLRSYHPGNYNAGPGALDYTKGFWDNSLAFLSRDSNGAYLTALRGFSFSLQPDDNLYLATTLASPKTLWQDYAEIDNLISSTRLKYYVADNLLLGSTLTTRTGFNTEEGTRTESQNYVGGLDVGYEVSDGVKASAEVLASNSYYDLKDSQYKTQARGNVYYFSLVTRYPGESIMGLPYGYDEIKLGKEEQFLLKSRFYAARMDEGFDSALSSYHNTRQDTFWGRHISFRRPADYYYSGLKTPSSNWDEINAAKIGDGIDIGRNVLGLRVEALERDGFSNLFDVRNVHKTNGKYVETVARDEITMKPQEKLTVKLLGLYQDLPKTKAAMDPFIYDGDTGEFLRDWSSDPIDDGKDPSLKTGAVGLEYAFYEWLIANSIFECTNDYALAYGNFPRGLFNSGQLGSAYYEYGNKYRASSPYLYDQQVFPQPPYPFYNIYQFGLRLLPAEKLDIYLDYTRNEFELAGQNSDKMNHVGLEVAYMPTKKFGMLFKYTYSRWKDPTLLKSGITEIVGHHNFFTEFRYLASKDDEFILQYGEGNTSPVGSISFDPYGGSLLTLDTQHIVRAYYRKKF
jgi:hypothetical protein